jgi:hypothetical protein
VGCDATGFEAVGEVVVVVVEVEVEEEKANEEEEAEVVAGDEEKNEAED